MKQARLILSNTSFCVLLGLIGTVWCQCLPIAVSPPEITATDQTALRCSIRNQPDCTNNILSMIWKKGLNSDAGVMFETAFQLFLNDTYRLFELPDYVLGERAGFNVFQNQYDLTISSAILKDSGKWKCVMEYKDGTLVDGEVLNLSVTNKVEQSDINIKRLNDTDYIITEPYLYECAVEGVYPEVDIIWFVNNIPQKGGVPSNQLGLYLWDLKSTITLMASVLDEVPVTCSVAKNEGTLKWDTNNTLTEANILTPAWIENTTVSETTINVNTILTISCTASGKDVRIRWFKDNQELNYPENNLFSGTTEELTGDFKFGQENALKQVLVGKQSTNARCKLKEQLQGTYQCRVDGVGGTDAVSEEIHVTFEHIGSCMSEEVFGFLIFLVIAVGSTLIAVPVVYLLCFHKKGNTTQ